MQRGRTAADLNYDYGVLFVCFIFQQLKQYVLITNDLTNLIIIIRSRGENNTESSHQVMNIRKDDENYCFTFLQETSPN